MDILEQQEMLKNRLQVTSKRNDWFDCLVMHVPKSIKGRVSGAFKTFKDKVMGYIMGLLAISPNRIRLKVENHGNPKMNPLIP